jgi:AraC family transcriptional regulator, regulatory protein of adaptative response / methylated-DNA-[protein]-cysteine methyltransferase
MATLFDITPTPPPTLVQLVAMTADEYAEGGKNLTIVYTAGSTDFGEVLVAATHIGICHLAFFNQQSQALADLQRQFPKAQLQPGSSPLHAAAFALLGPNGAPPTHLVVHAKGTAFQLKVWEALLRIPAGGITTYGHLAVQIAQDGAARAVGRAVGSNPVAYLIPCHRVMPTGGGFGGYRWGVGLKAALLRWEAGSGTGV